MKKFISIASVFVFFFFAFTGCSKKEEPPVNFIQMNVGGTKLTLTRNLHATKTTDRLEISGEGTGGSIFIHINPLQTIPAAYNVLNFGNGIVFGYKGNTYVALTSMSGDPVGNGSITITEQNKDYVEGRFEFKAFDDLGSPITVSEGEFRVQRDL